MVRRADGSWLRCGSSAARGGGGVGTRAGLSRVCVGRTVTQRSQRCSPPRARLCRGWPSEVLPEGSVAGHCRPILVKEHEELMFTMAIPVLHVSSAVAAEEFYRRLGFRKEFGHRADERTPDPCYMGFSRDHAWLHVSSFSGDGVSGSVAMVLVGDVDRLYEKLLRQHVPIALEPTDQTWGNREMYVRDPDGNSIRFVQPAGG